MSKRIVTQEPLERWSFGRPFLSAAIHKTAEIIAADGSRLVQFSRCLFPWRSLRDPQTF